MLLLLLLLLLLLFLKYFLAFWVQGMWDLSSRPGIKLTPPALEGEAVNTGSSGKSPQICVLKHNRVFRQTSVWGILRGLGDHIFPMGNIGWIGKRSGDTSCLKQLNVHPEKNSRQFPQTFPCAIVTT